MKKKLTVLLMAVLCMTLLTGCFCQHVWKDATCKAPKTCTKCGETEGEASSHDFLPATCIRPRTCKSCGLTEGSTAEHTWIDATCTQAKTCSVCGETEGDVLDHSWADATTDAPKTCTLCGVTEGDPIETDPRFTSASAAPLLGKWSCEITLNGQAMGLENFPGEVAFALMLDFGSAGEFGYGIEVQDEEAFTESMIQYTLANIYDQYAAQGLDQESTNAIYWDSYNMTAEGYVRQTISAMNISELFSTLFSGLDIGGVYYVDGPFIYSAQTWEDDMDFTMFGFDENGALYINDYCQELGIDARFLRVTEEAQTESTEADAESTDPTEETVEETTPETAAETTETTEAETSAEE